MKLRHVAPWVIMAVVAAIFLFLSPRVHAQSGFLGGHSVYVPSRGANLREAPAVRVIPNAVPGTRMTTLPGVRAGARAEINLWATTPPQPSVSPARLPAAFSLGLISQMTSSIQWLDTPFVSQVHLPIASLWSGRLKLGGFESTIPMDRMLWGLPEAGGVQDLSPRGGGRYPVLAPAQNDSFGLHLALHFRGGQTGSGDNSGLRGVRRALRAGRDLFRL